MCRGLHTLECERFPDAESGAALLDRHNAQILELLGRFNDACSTLRIVVSPCGTLWKKRSYDNTWANTGNYDLREYDPFVAAWCI